MILRNSYIAKELGTTTGFRVLGSTRVMEKEMDATGR